ncbi:phage minor head protein [Albimonas sp. CAU 1670]|uniref:phage minor head protein n=1 Tax=Albimonas sp. CAU 1670 TaxID=3032599 RepID=UPI0023DCE64C|nr:phage minor head protein [Albimonas sp. CAU 1670]MDF2232183.1 phage minor head protein [Albimonas sp. CAU 1670]
MVNAAGVLRQPFKEQVAAYRLRLGELVPTARWDDIEREAHDRAFMVAGAAKADLLADLAAAVDRAVTEGTGIEAFRKDFRAIVERRGWHGWTGEGTAAGEAWRTRTIYKTNMLTSYAAGRHAQLRAGGFDFWVYRHSGAEHPRLDHLSWNGLVLEADHPFWAQHYPPNGWGCGCKVRGAHSRRGARRVGGDPDKALPEGWDAIDPKTGAPKGLGKGWDYAPGASVQAEIRASAEKVVRWPYEIGKAYMTSLPPAQADALSQAYRRLPSLADDLRRYAERALGERNGAPIAGPVLQEKTRTLGLLTSDQQTEVGAILGDVAGFDFVMTSPAVEHIRARHGDPETERRRGQIAIGPADYRLLPLLLAGWDELKAGEEPERIQVSRTIGGERVHAIFERRANRRLLALITMWRVKVGGAPRSQRP